MPLNRTPLLNPKALCEERVIADAPDGNAPTQRVDGDRLESCASVELGTIELRRSGLGSIHLAGALALKIALVCTTI